MPTDYIPQNDAEKVAFLLNIENKIDGLLAELGITAAEATVVKARCSKIRTDIGNAQSAKTTAKQAVEKMKTTIVTEEAELRNSIQTWKLRSTFTDSTAAALNVKAAGTVEPTESEYKAAMSAAVYPGKVSIKFFKKGVEGVNVYTRLKGTSNFMKLAYDSHSPYEDNRPLAVAGVPENREYMIMGVLDDEEIGLPSDIVAVVFGG
jgi:hypothetical protein